MKPTTTFAKKKRTYSRKNGGGNRYIFFLPIVFEVLIGCTSFFQVQIMIVFGLFYLSEEVGPRRMKPSFSDPAISLIVAN